jgi:hypothetical protein
MGERQDDTTQPGERDAPPEPERAPGNYYYDDGTGYEIYDPAADDDDTDESEMNKSEADEGKTDEGKTDEGKTDESGDAEPGDE